MTGPASTTEPTRRRSFASSGITYARVAADLSLRLCDGSSSDCPVPINHTHESHIAAHEDGYATINALFGRRLHWRQKRTTKRGLYRFLKLAATILFYEDTVKQPSWIDIYQRNIIAGRLGARYGIRFPRSYSERDRAMVRKRLDVADLTEYNEKSVRRVRAWAKSSTRTSSKTPTAAD